MIVWRQALCELYCRHPAYKDYPVVGVNWLKQTIMRRTDRNEQIMIREGILHVNPAQVNEDNFTDAYLAVSMKVL